MGGTAWVPLSLYGAFGTQKPLPAYSLTPCAPGRSVPSFPVRFAQQGDLGAVVQDFLVDPPHDA
jgi:hypothetical protein